MNVARCEAESLFAMVGRGESLDHVRELIGVPAEIQGVLHDYVAFDPAEASWVDSALRFRQAVSAEFERLVSRGSLEGPCVPPQLTENKELAEAQTPDCG